ncbi:accessory gene regulator ArgB-like protein [Anaerovorax odorimutans]|uniref:accessory gene regulator ArgB-like protein n=1 Tax=Anaerovorax odorimutans TaxID=109327 RepID=UPI0004064FB2|nr:accessory gene regulator B family protein [Anaerovorax odorimutans]
MGKISDTITEKIKKETNLSHIDTLKVNYALEAIFNELIKMIILFIFYYFLGQAKLYIFCLLILLPVRVNSGGLHMKTNITCFIFSFMFFLLAIVLLPKLKISLMTYIVLLVLSVVIIWIFSPIATRKRPIVSKEKYKRCKMLAILGSTVIAIFLLLLIKHSTYFQCGVWVFALQALQLMVAYIKQKKERGLSYEKI